MLKQTISLFVWYWALVVEVLAAYNSAEPIWLVSPYFRAGNNQVISTTTGAGTKPTYTFTFSSPVSGIPNLAYGVKNYRGNVKITLRPRHNVDRKF